MVNTPKPIKINPIISETEIAKTPAIIKNSVIRVNSKQSKPGIFKHFPRQPITSNNIPATITPIVIKLMANPVARRKTPRPTKIKPITVVAKHKIFLQFNIYITSFGAQICESILFTLSVYCTSLQEVTIFSLYTLFNKVSVPLQQRNL
jgi:hypothetical protein